MKSLILLLLFIPSFALAVWWNPLTWFSDTSEIQEIQQANVSQVSWFPESFNEPELTEEIIEIPKKEIVIEYVEVPVEKIVTKIEYIEIPVEKIVIQTVTEPADPNLIIELQQWKQAFDEFKPELYNLVSASSTQTIIDAFQDLKDEYRDIHTQYIVYARSYGATPIPYRQIEIPEVESCYFTTTGDFILGTPKGKIVCEVSGD